MESRSEMTQERRSEIRLPVSLAGLLLDSNDRPIQNVPLDTQVLDVSRSGLKIQVWHDAPIGSLFGLSVKCGDDDSLCLAEVVWKREGTAGMIYGLRVTHWTYLSPRLDAMMSLHRQETQSLKWMWRISPS